MKICSIVQVGVLWLIPMVMLFGQSNTNGIPEDFVPLLAVIPLYGDSAKTIQTSNVIVTIKTDTLAKVSKYICRQRIL